MPNDWDDNDDSFEDPDESNLVKQLRQQIKAKNAELKTATDRLSVLEPQVRTSSLASILSGLKVTDPRVAKLMPKDLDVNEENVKAWLDEYGDLFNIKTDETPGDNGSQQQQSTEGQAPSTNQEAWQKFQAQSSNSGNLTPDNEAQQLAMLQAANDASSSFDEFAAMLRGERPIPS